MASVKQAGMMAILRDDPTKPVSVVADDAQFHIRINKNVLVTQGSKKKPSKARTFKSLTKAAYFLKELGVESFTVDVKQLPPPPPPKRKSSKTEDKPEAAAATPAAATPAPANAVAATTKPARKTNAKGKAA